MTDYAPNKEAIAERCRLLRIAIEGNDGDARLRFANHLGIHFSRWTKVESGRSLSTRLAMLLVGKIPGLTLDWLYLGKTNGLSAAMICRLEEAQRLAREWKPKK